MRTPDNERLRKLEQALLEAHRARKNQPWEMGWAEGVMREVHRRARYQGPAHQNGEGARFVWQAASFAVALAVLMGALLIISSLPVDRGSGLVAEETELGSLFLE